MRTFPWEKGVLILAVDPAQLVTGLAWSTADAEGRPLQGTASFGDILESADMEKHLRRLVEASVHERVWVAVEYPRWNAGASQVVRAAANTYVRLLRRVFGSKLEVVKVDPNVWQRAFSFSGRRAGQTTKEYSLFTAERVYGWVCEGIADRADAALILEWLRANPIPPKAPKSKKRKK